VNDQLFWKSLNNANIPISPVLLIKSFDYGYRDSPSCDDFQFSFRL
jgi:hypothetical protein